MFCKPSVLTGFLTLSTAAIVQPAHSQSPPTEPTAQVIHVAALTDEQVGAVVPNLGTIRSKSLVSLPSGTVAVQVGDAPKHAHQQSVEIQYVIAGEGTVWLGDKEVRVQPGDLIVVPKGTAHGGSHATRGHFKMLSIKLPPAAAGDFQKLP